jgi:hypothetical protein
MSVRDDEVRPTVAVEVRGGEVPDRAPGSRSHPGIRDAMPDGLGVG